MLLTIKLGDKTYSTSRITAYLSKEAMRINKDVVVLGKQGIELQKGNIGLDDAEKLMDDLLDLSARKANLICEVYGNKFTIDELEKEFTSTEIDIEIRKIMLGINEIVTKN